MKKINSFLGFVLCTCFSGVNAGPINPLNVTYLDININGGCGVHLEINHVSGIVTGRGTGCFNFAEDQKLIGSVGNSNRLGTNIGVLIPSQAAYYVIDDSPKKWYAYNIFDGKLVNSGDYILGAPF